MSDALWSTAGDVLRGNDAGGWTVAAPGLYPHQWSWDTGFIAIGWAHLDPERALRELEHLLAAQWADGKLPHIVFDASHDAPEADWWDSARSPNAPPVPVRTSGLCQPPVHALALEAIVRRAGDALERLLPRLRAAYERIVAWHRYLTRERDPDGTGLVTIYHPWEGLDNSPRWDDALARLTVGALPAYRRRDLQHVADAAERPDDVTYDRYVWLVELLKRARYDDAEVSRRHPFQIKDVLFSAILVAANDALVALGERLGASTATLAEWAQRGRRGLGACWDRELRLCVDHDLRDHRPIRRRTVAGFAPLIARVEEPRLRAALLEELASPRFAGAPGLRWPLPPSTSPCDPGFEPRNYWRGPVWPAVNWLLWRALRGMHADHAAERLRRAGLDQIRGGGFAEYFEPFSGEPLGARRQSWTAAVALDWLAADGRSARAA